MRVISGSAGGRKLKQPPGMSVRPTTDRVKEAIFNIIQFDIEGRHVLDLFSGTGQLGIETLSRGALSAVFVDDSNEAVKLVRDNLLGTDTGERAEVVRGNALSYLKRGSRFDMIFLDPPYDSTLLEKALETIIEFDKLNENGIIICESKVGKQLPEVASPYFKGREYRYGKINITLYGKSQQEGEAAQP